MPESVSSNLETALDLAILFHDTYERLAPQFGYETRLETRTFSPSSKNGQLMRAVCEELLKALRAPAPETPAAPTFMYCSQGCLRCEHQDCIQNGCRLVRANSCTSDAESLARARELNAELRRAVKTSEARPARSWTCAICQFEWVSPKREPCPQCHPQIAEDPRT